MPRFVLSPVRHFIASIPVIFLLTPLFTALAQQKPAAPSPNSQAQLAEHVKELERRLNEADQKAAGAAMEKDYITRVQKQYETYYEKVVNTQMWTLGIMGLILTAVFGLAGRFSIDIFDSRTKSALGAALAQVEQKFGEQMQKELETLRQQNSAQIKALEDGLTKRITEQEEDLKARSDYQFQFAQGLSFATNEVWGQAIGHFRRALEIYKSSKPRQLFREWDGVSVARNLVLSLKRKGGNEEIKKELPDDLYDGLEEELARVALELTWLEPLLKKGKQTPSSPLSRDTEKKKSEGADDH